MTWGAPAALGVFSLFVGWLLAGGTQFDLHVPLIYSGDGLLILTLIKRVMENPWIFHASAMGTPFGSSLYDYPIPDSGSLLALKVLGLSSGSPAIALNLYYLLGFPINALAAYFILKKFRISRVFCFAGGFIFTVLPFHFLRIVHLFYTWYFAAPVFIWYAYRIYTGHLNFTGKERGAISRSVDVIVLLVLSCFGVYYAFFGILAILTAGMMRYIRVPSVRSIFPSLLATAIVTIGVIANVTPNLIDRAQHDVNIEVAQRSPAEAEVYGLKIAQLLLPRSGHRFTPLAKLNLKYSDSFPLINENSFSSLGIIGSVGFLILLVKLFAFQRNLDEYDQIYFLASVTLALVLFCTIGGFSTLFSILVSPMIRAWNRVSVFIAFTSISASMLMVEFLIRRFWPRKPFVLSAVTTGIGLCALAVWDQTTAPCISCLDENQAEYRNDARFVASIEQRVPRNSAIYQLPYVGFPEVPPINRLEGYDEARGYLHSSSLEWSYGSVKGRPGDMFFRTLARQPLARQIEIARRAGFRGVYIDRRGYLDNGTAIEAELTHLLGAGPTVISDNAQQTFYDLAGNGENVAQLPRDLSPAQIMERADFVADASGERYRSAPSDGIDLTREGLPTFLSELDGLSTQESWGRWSDAHVSPEVTLRFASPLPKHFVVHLRAQGFGPNVGKPTKVVIGQQIQTLVPAAEMREFSLPFTNVDDATLIEIRPPQPASPDELGMSSDGRKLGIGLQKIWIENKRAVNTP